MDERITDRYTTIALCLFCASFYSFASRDALAADVGLQGPIQLALVLLALLLLVWVAVTRRSPLLITPQVVLFAAYCTLGTASFVNSFDIRVSLGKSVIVCSTLAIAVLLVSILPTPLILRKVYWIILIFNCIGVLISLVAPDTFPLFAPDQSGKESWRVRMNILQTHPLAVADLCGIAFLIGLSPSSKSRWWTQLLFFGFVVATGSRTCLAFLVLCLALRAILSMRQRAQALLFFATIVAAIILTYSGAMLLDPSFSSDETYEIAGGDEGAVALNGRLPLWRYASTIWNEHFPLGFGFEGARAKLIKYSEWAGHSHNAFIEVYLIAGPLGWLAFIAAWFSTAFRNYRCAAERSFIPIHAYLAVTSFINPVVTGVAGPGLLLLSLAIPPRRAPSFSAQPSLKASL